MKALVLLLQLLGILSTGLNISVLYPFVLASPALNITTIDKDLDNSFLVGFSDGQARRYSPDFSSYTPLAVPEVVDMFSSSSFSFSFIFLLDGTIWNMIGRMTSTLSNNHTTLRTYSHPDFLPIDSVSFP
jgi:hypothetical protein